MVNDWVFIFLWKLFFHNIMEIGHIWEEFWCIFCITFPVFCSLLPPCSFQCNGKVGFYVQARGGQSLRHLRFHVLEVNPWQEKQPQFTVTANTISAQFVVLSQQHRAGVNGSWSLQDLPTPMRHFLKQFATILFLMSQPRSYNSCCHSLCCFIYMQIARHIFI